MTNSGRRLSVRGLTIEFPFSTGWLPVAQDISFDVRSGEVVALVGESGSGKSITALAAMRLVPRPGRVAAGAVMLDDMDVLALGESDLRRYRGGRVAMVFQDAMTSLNPTHSVGSQIAESAQIHCRLTRSRAQARAVELLKMVGIPDAQARAGDYPHQFSGGMRQRVMIAMALAGEPDVLIADEATTALDVTVQAQILDILERLRSELGMSVLLITHDLGVAARIADTVSVMYAGRIVESGAIVEVFRDPKMPYTDGLLRAMPRLDVPTAALKPIPGSPPEPREISDACRFAPRCPHAREACRLSEPRLTRRGSERMARCHGTEPDGWLVNGEPDDRTA